MRELLLLTPVEGSALERRVLNGSALVSSGFDDKGEGTLVFEGNCYGFRTLSRFDARVARAVNGVTCSQPSSSWLHYSREEVDVVARLNLDAVGRVRDVEWLRPELLQRWLNREQPSKQDAMLA